MKAESCREWQESLGAYALGKLPENERAGLEAHLEGCPACRAELESLSAVAALLPLADPDSFHSAPMPDPSLRKRILGAIGDERRVQRRRRRAFGLSLGAAAAAAAAVLALIVLPGGGKEPRPEQHVEFASVPRDLRISANLIPHAYGTEIHVYVHGAPSGALCRVFVRSQDGTKLPAGSFRYRWGDDSLAILSSALDLSRTAAIGVRVDDRTFVAPVRPSETAAIRPTQEEQTWSDLS
jgi:anti-sigma factor RsiW